MLENNIKVEVGDQYIYAFQTGEINLENSLSFWKRIAVACNEANIFRILGESKDNNNLSLRDAFQHIHFFKILEVKSYPKIAWVNHVPQQDDTYLFIENLLNNRKLADTKVFTDFNHAKNWLLNTEEQLEEDTINLLDDSIFIFNK